MRILFFFSLLFCIIQVSGQKLPEVMELNRNWYFSEAGSDKWLPADVPGTVQQDLIRHQLLPFPFYGKNEEKIQWVEEKDWEYKTTFTVTAPQLERDDAILYFEGLDTYADVYLNGALILNADNMFVGYEVPVKGLLREGINQLHILFRSPIGVTLPQWRSNGFNHPADNDHRAERLSVFTRKAPYSYGWDWGIRMVTSGVWRPASLVFADRVAIRDFYIRQLSLTDEVADLSCELDLKNLSDAPLKATVTVACSLDGKLIKSQQKEVVINVGQTSITMPLDIQNPKRWMPNGWGDPVLYDMTATVNCDGQQVAEKHHRTGLRTLRVVREKDEHGESFYFEVNGKPMFAKGANYIPGDAMLPAMTTERYKTLFQDIRDANMNMVRVWGGGSYEDDRFYDLADENGILVWQDFMFACTTYPHDSVFLSRVEAEVVYNICRLRNHACLAMWCGNNEILEGIKYWGWSSKYDPAVYQDMKKGYDLLFNDLLPRKVGQLDSGRFYMHGSPYSANWGRPESWKVADSHNWGVWYGRKPFESLDAEIPRFMSEFGFQSFPEMKTIATFADTADYQIESPVMNAHQKSTIGNDLIRTYMERDYVVPGNFEDFVYVGLVLQGQGMRRGLEAHRRNRPYCMGTLYWQLNDSWPVVSWSGIDYYGNWKALHYQARRAFAPLTVDVLQQGDSLGIWLLSDLLEDAKGLSLSMQLCDFGGKVLQKQTLKTEVAANTSVCIRELPVASLLTAEQRCHCYWLLTLKDKSGQVVFREPYFFNSSRELDLPATLVTSKIKVSDGACELTLSSPQLAKDVFIEIPVQGARFSDNFFDLLPGEVRKITVTSPQFKRGDKVEVKVRHLKSY